MSALDDTYGVLCSCNNLSMSYGYVFGQEVPFF